MSRKDGSQSLDGFCPHCGDKSCDMECQSSCRVCGSFVMLEDGLEWDGPAICHLCEITALENDLDFAITALEKIAAKGKASPGDKKDELAKGALEVLKNAKR